jgi:hypothetical protein
VMPFEDEVERGVVVIFRYLARWMLSVRWKGRIVGHS